MDGGQSSAFDILQNTEADRFSFVTLIPCADTLLILQVIVPVHSISCLLDLPPFHNASKALKILESSVILIQTLERTDQGTSVIVSSENLTIKRMKLVLSCLNPSE